MHAVFLSIKINLIITLDPSLLYFPYENVLNVCFPLASPCQKKEQAQDMEHETGER